MAILKSVQLPGALIRGIPEKPDRPVKLPEGCTKAKVRFRNDSWAMIVCRIGDSFVRRPLLDAGDHFVTADFVMEQGRNVRIQTEAA